MNDEMPLSLLLNSNGDGTGVMFFQAAGEVARFLHGDAFGNNGRFPLNLFFFPTISLSLAVFKNSIYLCLSGLAARSGRRNKSTGSESVEEQTPAGRSAAGPASAKNNQQNENESCLDEVMDPSNGWIENTGVAVQNKGMNFSSHSHQE